MRRFLTLAAILLAAGALLAAACGGDDSDATGGGRDRPPPTLAPGEERTLGLDGETFVYARTLPGSSFVPAQLESAGTAISAGQSVAVARADASAESEPWELLSRTADGWDVWQPGAARRVLAAAGPDATLVTVAAVDWPNACLGLAAPNELCAEVITPGYRIVVERGGERIEYHTDRAGSFRLAGGQ